MLNKPRILVVVDESGIADTIQYVLATDGFAPVWCRTADEVALGLRGLSRKQKLALTEDMATMEWPPTWVEPPEVNTTARKEKPVAL